MAFPVEPANLPANNRDDYNNDSNGRCKGRICTNITEKGKSVLEKTDTSVGFIRYLFQTIVSWGTKATSKVELGFKSTGFVTSVLVPINVYDMGKSIVKLKEEGKRKEAAVDLAEATSDATGNASTVLGAAGEFIEATSSVAARVSLAASFLMGISAAIYLILIPVAIYKIIQDRKHAKELDQVEVNTALDYAHVDKEENLKKKKIGEWQKSNAGLITDMFNDIDNKFKIINLLKDRIQQRINSKVASIVAMIVVIVAVGIFLAAVANPIVVGVAFACLTAACLISLSKFGYEKYNDYKLHKELMKLAPSG